MEQLEGRVAVVTGGAAGIGLGMARAFAGAGMRVVLADVREEAIDGAVAELTGQGHEAIGVPTDVVEACPTSRRWPPPRSTRSARSTCCATTPASACSRPIAQTSIEDWEWMLEIDLWGPIYGVKTFLPIIEREERGPHQLDVVDGRPARRWRGWAPTTSPSTASSR